MPPNAQAEPTAAEETEPLSADLYCPDCGYSLRGLTSGRCPECGLAVDADSTADWVVPWERRREIGRVRAYWRTVWTVMFRHKHFRRAALRPMHYADAQRFRWVTIAVALLPPLLLAGFGFAASPDDFEEILEDTIRVGGWSMLLAPLLPVLFLVLATGLPSYLFHPRYLPVELQNRAIAMSYYTCAALAWMWLPAILAGAALVLSEAGSPARGGLYDWMERAVAVLMLLAVLLVPTMFVAWWLDLNRLARAVLRRPGALAKVAVDVPVLWLFAGGFVFFIVPLVVLFVLAVVYSLTG